MAKITWDSSKCKAGIVDKVKRNLLKIGMSMAGDIKKSMKKGYGAYSLIEGQKEVKGVRRTKKGRRHYPSPPGEPPAVDYGRLWGSISVNWTGSGKGNGDVVAPAKGDDGVKEPGGNVTNWYKVAVGTNIQDPPYPFFLELGTIKMKPRPFIRPVYWAYRSKVISMLAKK